MQLLGDLDLLPFVITSRLNWICHINRMDSKRQESQVFDNNHQGSWYCATSRTVSGSIPSGVTGHFFRSYRRNHVPWGRLSL